MKISVITVCYNSAATIRDTVESVVAQDYPDVEYIIVDGGSSDHTLNILRAYETQITKLISEPDRGIYDAMNKGLKLATGDIIGFINADDFYNSKQSLSLIAQAVQAEDIEACYGDLSYISRHNSANIVRYWRSSDFKPGLFAKAWCPPHPTFYARRSVFERFGDFDLNYKIAADMELMLRFMEVNKIRTRYIPAVLVKMRTGGASDGNLRSILAQNQEIFSAFIKHRIKISAWRFWLNKIMARVRQFIMRPA